MAEILTIRLRIPTAISEREAADVAADALRAAKHYMMTDAPAWTFVVIGHEITTLVPFGELVVGDWFTIPTEPRGALVPVGNGEYAVPREPPYVKLDDDRYMGAVRGSAYFRGEPDMEVEVVVPWE